MYLNSTCIANVTVLFDLFILDNVWFRSSGWKAAWTPNKRQVWSNVSDFIIEITTYFFFFFLPINNRVTFFNRMLSKNPKSGPVRLRKKMLWKKTMKSQRKEVGVVLPSLELPVGKSLTNQRYAKKKFNSNYYLRVKDDKLKFIFVEQDWQTWSPKEEWQKRKRRICWGWRQQRRKRRRGWRIKYYLGLISTQYLCVPCAAYP